MVNTIKIFLILLIVISPMFGKLSKKLEREINTNISLFHSFIYNYNIDALNLASIKLLKKKQIKAIYIKDSIDEVALFSGYFTKDGVIKGDIPLRFNKYEKFEQDIKYNNELLGKITIFFEDIIITPTNSIGMSKDEIKYIKTKKIIKMCNDPGWKPIDFVENSIPQGISIDTIKLIEKLIGNDIKIQYIKTDSWKQSQEFVKLRKCDIIPAAIKNDKRLQYANFTKSYIHYKLMIITRDDIDFISSLESYKNKKIARTKGSGLIPLLKDKFIGINIVETNSYKQMFEKVASGEVFATIATLPVSLYFIKQYGYTNLKVSGSIDKMYDLSIGARNDEPQLVSILNKALNKITQKQHNNIFNKWISIKVTKQVDYTLVFQIASILLFILLWFIYFNRRLSILVDEKTKALSNLNISLEEKVKEKTKELEIAKQKAEELTKLKSEFLANMSHEIRTPINSIVGMSHLLLETNLSNKQQNYLHKISISSKSLLEIINDILDFSKIEAKKLNINKIEFNLFTVIENIISLVEIKASEKNLKLIVNYDISVGKYFYGDSLRISQIILNLVTNAIKFTLKGEIKIYIKKLPNDRMKFEIQDTGIGLSKEHQSKLFKSFSQADGSTTRKYGGTGLGLAISKQLVELMKGKILVKSEIGVGSNFIFEIELKKIINLNNNIKSQNSLILNRREISINKDELNKKTISKKLENKLWNNLKNAIETNIPKECEPIIIELTRYNLSLKSNKLFIEVKMLVENYEFDKAKELLNGYNYE